MVIDTRVNSLNTYINILNVFNQFPDLFFLKNMHFKTIIILGL